MNPAPSRATLVLFIRWLSGIQPKSHGEENTYLHHRNGETAFLWTRPQVVRVLSDDAQFSRLFAEIRADSLDRMYLVLCFARSVFDGFTIGWRKYAHAR